MMIALGWMLYVMGGAILALFWWNARGLTFEELVERSALEHEVVKQVFAHHPRGGSWREFSSWYAREAAAITSPQSTPPDDESLP